MKNKLIDLNNHLFAQLERLSDEDLTDEQVKKEVTRSQAVVSLSDQIVKNSALRLKAHELNLEYGGGAITDPLLLEKGDRR